MLLLLLVLSMVSYRWKKKQDWAGRSGFPSQSMLLGLQNQRIFPTQSCQPIVEQHERSSIYHNMFGVLWEAQRNVPERGPNKNGRESAGCGHLGGRKNGRCWPRPRPFLFSRDPLLNWRLKGCTALYCRRGSRNCCSQPKSSSPDEQFVVNDP
jgi:hypothetical protein